MDERTGDFSFARVADLLGLGRLSDGDPGMDPRLLRQLYRHCRNEDGRRICFVKDATFVNGWINLNSGPALEIISAFVPMDDSDNLSFARNQAKANLEAQGWNDVLGIDSPPIRCVVKIHGTKWGLRFKSAASTLKGQECLNEALPACKHEDDVVSGQPVGSKVTKVQAQPNEQRGTKANVSAADILREGGLPA